MKRYILTTFSLPVDGEEAAYNKWYSEVHFGDLLQIAGVKTAQRFKPQETEGSVKNPYLSIYEIETEDISKVMQSMQDGSHEMYISPALDITSIRIQVYEVLGDKQVSK
jgi:hypothetical protein